MLLSPPPLNMGMRLTPITTIISGEMAVPAAFTLLDMAEIMEITATKSRTVVKISPKSRP